MYNGIIKKIMDNIDPRISMTAVKADENAVNEILDRAKEYWDRGYSFVVPEDADVMAMLEDRMREYDSDDEIKAAAKEVEDNLYTIAEKYLIAQISRESAIATRNVIASLDTNPRIKILGREMSLSLFVDKWNNAHPDDKIYFECYPEI